MKRLAQYDTYELPVKDIYFDGKFNCRGSFTPQSVGDLADSIREIGLEFPVVVQPYDKQPGFKYRLLAGHRRFRAVTIFLKWAMIPGMVRRGLSNHQARLLNLTENLERKDLNILEEAKALRNLYPEGVPLRKAAKELKRHTKWVHARLRLLELPEEVQTWAATGLISAANIDHLHSLSSPERQIVVAKSIVFGKKTHGKTKPLHKHTEYAKTFHPRKTKQQLADMVKHLFTVSCTGLASRVLAWAAGKISDADIEQDIQDASTYQCPDGYKSPYTKD